jgi:hypothetical protein
MLFGIGIALGIGLQAHPVIDMDIINNIRETDKS